MKGRLVSLQSSIMFLGVWLSFGSALATTIAVNPDQALIELSGNLEYLEEPQRAYTVQQAMAAETWQSANGEAPSLGFTTSVYWFRITLEYGYGHAPIDRILEIAYGDLQKVHVWFLTGDGPIPTPTVTGGHVPIFDREIPADNFAFPVAIEPGKPVTVVIRTWTDESLVMPVRLYDAKTYRRDYFDTRLAEGTFYGILLVMFFYNGFLLVSIRERAYLSYCLFIFATLMIQMVMDGTYELYIYNNKDYDPSLHYIGVILGSLSFLTRDFLHLKERSPIQDRAMIGFGVVGVLIALNGGWLPYDVVFEPILLTSLAGALSIVVIGFINLIQGDPATRFFMAAFGAYFVGLLLMLAGLFGWLPHNFFTQHGMQLGSAFEVTLLSLALADRIKHLEIARQAAAQEIAQKERAEKETRRDLEHSRELLIHSEKLANLGVMISGLGHEIANPINAANMSLGVIEGDLEDLREQLAPLFDDSPEAAAFKAMLDSKFEEIGTTCGYMGSATARLRELSGALRSQARDERTLTDAVDLNDVVRESMVIARAKTASMVVKSHLGELPPTRCYRTRVGQVVTNLISNAADALVERKEELTGQPFHAEIEVSTEVCERKSMQGVLISVSDNGTGVPEEIRQKIFEQFFTTKAAGVGTGLGLSLCASIIKDHEGTMEVDDAPELGGARFQVWLPLDGGSREDESRVVS